MASQYLKLMLVTNRQTNDLLAYYDFIEKCLLGGVTSIQLREKNSDSTLRYRIADKLKQLTSQYNAALIINDYLDLAVDIDADGIHLGQSDTDVILARQRLGADKIIGLSLEAEEQLNLSNKSPINYVAASAVFPTENKKNLKKLWGLPGLAYLSQQSLHPVIAIGGIHLTNIDHVMSAGACGIAVIGALHHANNPTDMAKQLLEKINKDHS